MTIPHQEGGGLKNLLNRKKNDCKALKYAYTAALVHRQNLHSRKKVIKIECLRNVTEELD